MIDRRELLRGLGALTASTMAVGAPNRAFGLERGEPSAARVEDFAPGVRPSTDLVRSAEEAARLAVALARESAKQKSFGVGGFLIDRTGRVLAQATNCVLRDGELRDPTAHVERQLVDWYAYSFGKQHRIPASELTIVSSLDPCAMCAGAILRSGMRVIAIAEDKEAGVHSDLKPLHMPLELRARAAQDMAFFGIRGDRPAAGGIAAQPLLTSISADLLVEARQVLLDSVSEVRRTVAGTERTNEPVRSLTEDMRKKLPALSAPFRETIVIEDRPINISIREQRRELLARLVGDRCALVDDAGNVILIATGLGRENDAETSVLQSVRHYNSIRTAARDQLSIGLPPPGSCSIIKRRAPENPATALMEFGALGSFAEEPRTATTIPAMGCLDSENVTRAQSWAETLPPFYHRIGIGVGIVAVPQ